MSRTLSKSLGTDLPALAQMIRDKGRGRDTVLAHITPQEAALLKRRGGRGSTNPDTGLPEYEDEDFMGAPVNIDTGETNTPEMVAEQYPQYYPGGELPQENQATMYTPGGGAASVQEQPDYSQFAYPSAPVAPAAAAAPASAPAKPPTDKPGFMDKLGSFLSDPANLAKFGILGGLGVFGAKKGAQASEQGAAAAAQIKNLAPPVLARSEIAQTKLGDLATNITEQTRINAQELSALGAPQRELGLQLMSQAQAGALTPAGERALAALKAQSRQNISKRGGVGVMQAGVAESDATANLLQSQLQQGLGTYQQGAQYAASGIAMQQQAIAAANNMRVSAINTAISQAGIADQYTMQAINVGLSQDRATAQALQAFYSQLAQVGFGSTVGRAPIAGAPVT